MPFPMNPGDAPAVDPGPPAPIVDDSLGDPDPADVAAPPSIEEIEAADPSSTAAALPIDTPIVLGTERSRLTVLSYLRDATPDGVLIHVMATADGADPSRLEQLSLELRLPGGDSAQLVLPAQSLAMGDSWEADLLFPVVAADLAPGASVLRLVFPGQAAQFVAV